MAILARGMRLLHLEALVRLRRLGAWPWFALLGWGLLAASQEPRLLRGFGINVSWQGMWSGATILLLALASSGSSPRASGNTGVQYLRIDVIHLSALGVGLAVGLGVTQAAIAWVADALTGQPTAFAFAVRSALGFGLALAPASVACTCLAPVWSAGLAVKLVLVGTVGFSLSLSAVCSSAPGASVAAASLLATAGAAWTSALLASAASVIRTPTPHANRHSR